jgi:protoporphyrinogen oxidase
MYNDKNFTPHRVKMQTSMKNKFVILGAGISGLTAARVLKEAGRTGTVLEACPSAGGLSRTVKVREFCFDYTGHFLHLARFNSPAAIPYAGLKDADWERLERRACCHIDGHFVAAPIQYHLSQLPPHLYQSCVASYEQRTEHADGSDRTFKDYIISGFGRELADIFLIPQNEKTLATSLDTISGSAVKRFFPPPDDKRIQAGIESAAARADGYNAWFWYPRMGGIERLAEGIKNDVKDIQLLEEAAAIDVEDKTLRTTSGRSLPWDVLLSSIPLPDLCRKTGDQELSALADSLRHSSTIVFNLGISAPLPEVLADVHWVYVPDPSVPFYRVGFYSNITKGMCPPGCSSLYVEVGVSGAEVDQVNIIDAVQPAVIKALAHLGWVRPEKIICSVAQVIRCAYVHHSFERERVIERIFERLKSFDIHPIGRYGLWDYISMEDSIISAIETVKKIL